MTERSILLPYNHAEFSKKRNFELNVRKFMLCAALFTACWFVVKPAVPERLATISAFFAHSEAAASTHDWNHLYIAEPAVPDVPVAVFEATVPAPAYEIPVANQTLFNDTVTDKVSFEYTAPAVAFTNVVFNVSVNASGVHHATFGTLFFNDVALWTTGTAQPGNRTTVSNTAKDLSEYATLLSNNGTFTLDFDAVDGELNVTVFASYFNSSVVQNVTDVVTVAARNSTLATSLFAAAQGPADSVVSLGTAEGASFAASAVKVSPKTVSALLRLFIRSSDDEEFWFSNVIDSSADKFPAHKLLGKGPVRAVKVFLDDILVAVEAPRPVISTEGISPALWTPVVGNNVFDLQSIDVSLTAFLPLLWAGAAVKVEIVTGSQVPTFGGWAAEEITEGPAGESWSISGSLLSWENENVTLSSGSVAVFPLPVPLKKEIIMSTGKWTPNKMNQIIIYKDSLKFSNTLQFALLNETVQFGVNVTNSIMFNNFQTYDSFGDSQKVVSIVVPQQEVELVNTTVAGESAFPKVAEIADYTKFQLCKTVRATKVLNTTIGSAKLERTYVNSVELNYTTPLELRVNMSQADSYKLSDAAKVLAKLDRKQNGTSTFFPANNTGFGSLDTDLTAMTAALPYYSRKIQAVNGTVTSDKEVPVFGKKPFVMTTYHEQMLNMYCDDMVSLEFMQLFS